MSKIVRQKPVWSPRSEYTLTKNLHFIPLRRNTMGLHTKRESLEPRDHITSHLGHKGGFVVVLSTKSAATC